MKVLSVNTSLAKNIEYNGKILPTGIFKKAVRGSVFISRTNLKGDQQCDLENHGGQYKAVYAFSKKHYAYWEKKLDRTRLTPGSFGENLTLSDFNEETIYIGDQIRIGECLLQVSQPRIPCYKLGIALNNNHMPRMFTASFATGVYMQVIEEGYVQAGDTVNIEKSSTGLSVKSLFRAYFDKSFPNSTNIMEHALTIPELSPEWQEKLTRRLSVNLCVH